MPTQAWSMKIYEDGASLSGSGRLRKTQTCGLFSRRKGSPVRTNHYISLDVHCEFTEIAVVTGTGQITKRHRCKTAIPSLLEAITGIAHPRYVTFEEGPMAEWLFRSLSPHADEVLVCEPRRNHLIAKDSEKDDPIDAEKLAQLYRGGYLKRVHHPHSLDRTIFKQHVGLYHDRVRDRVRAVNYLIAQFRHYGVFIKEDDFKEQEDRKSLLECLPASNGLREDLACLWLGYDMHIQLEGFFRQELVRQARQIEPIRRFQELPGIGWIRAATFYAYIDTPWRFKSKSALWKYIGIGLERRHSGSGPVHLRVAKQSNRRLKSMILGAALSAITQGANPFHDQYRHWLNEGGLSPHNARRNVARSQAATLWGMWKNGNDYRPDWVGVSVGSRQASPVE